MALKKKVLVGTLATTLAVGAFAGLPLSSKGLAEKLGVGVASAATVDQNLQVLVAKQQAFYNALQANGGLPLVQAVKASVQALDSDTQKTALGDLYTKLSSLADSDETNGLIALLGSLSLPFSTTTSVTDLLGNDDVKAVLQNLQDSIGDITTSEATSFLLALNNAAYSAIFSDSNLTAGKEAIAKEALNNALANDATAKALYDSFITNFFDGSETEFKDAVVDAYHAYRALPASVTSAGIATIGDQVDAAIPDVVRAFLSANLSGGGLGGGVSSGSGSISVSDFINSLSGLKDQLANASADEKQQLIDKALKDASAALAGAASINVSGLVTYDGDKASVAITSDAVAAYIQAISDVKAALTDAIGSADGLVIANPTFDLGDISVANASLGVSADVLKQLSDAGVQAVDEMVYGLTATLPITGDFAAGIDFGISKSDATADITKGLTSVSDVFSFSASLGGTAVEKFSQPITIKFPVKSVDGVDKELLSVVRIESDGSLSPQGGDLNSDGTVIVEPRYSFSSYTVVENKVTFNDIDTVQSWAGRQIQVIAAKGAIQGKSEGVFAPKDDVTRAEFAKMLITALNLDNSLAISSQFSDVSSSDWFAPYVAVAVDKGIINGRTATKFDPNAKITRAEMATMIARALKTVKGLSDVTDVDTALAGFSDAGKISASLKAGVALAASKNIVIGEDGGKFLPNNNANRAQAAVIIYRAINVNS